MSNGIDMTSIKIDQESVAQFDLALNDLLDETKIEYASRLDHPIETSRPSTGKIPPISTRSEKENSVNSSTITPRQNSLFNLSDSPRKGDSSSSLDAGFFTDVKPRKVVTSPAPPPIVQRSLSSSSNDWNQLLTNLSARSSVEQRPVIPNLMSLRKTSIGRLSPSPPKRSIALEETHHQMDESSRPGSSVSSASLPVSIISSKPDLISRPLIERYPKVIPQPSTTTKKFRVEFPKKSAPPRIPPMVIEGKKVTSARNSARDSDEHLQQSVNSTTSKISSGVQKSQNLAKISSTTSMTSITRDDNILKDESLTITDMPANKSIHRRSTNIDRKPTKSRAMEFTVRDGVKWQQASSE
jgi:hypothetical protein